MLSEVLVKKEISLNVLWSTVKNLLLHEPILFDVVYSVPPENSHYSSIGDFDITEQNILHLTVIEDCKVCFIGDFYTHTSNSQDFLSFNEHICDAFSLDEITKQSLNRN